MKLLRILPIVLMFVGALMMAERPAYAYTDPGTGLLAIQAAGSALVATGWYLRRKIHALLHRAEPAKHNLEEQPGVAGAEEPPRV